MVVEEIMTKNPVTVDSSQSIAEVIGTLYELDVRHLPVVDDGELVGIVSDRDLRGLVSFEPDETAEARGRRREPISSIMSGDVLSVSPETDLGEAIDLMLEHRVGAIPVVEEGSSELLGILSYVDVLRALRDSA